MSEYGKFTKEHLSLTKEGIELFNDQKYWECHEVFEDLWKEDVGDKARYVWWAVIQVAAACIHYRDNNIKGAQGLLKKSKEKFNKIREFKVSTEYVERYLDWSELESLVMRISDDAPIEDFKPLFDFRFKSYLSFKEYK